MKKKLSKVPISINEIEKMKEISINNVKKMKEIYTYIEAINEALDIGNRLLKILEKEQPIKKENIIVFYFLRKTLRLLEATICLIKNEFDEEAQITARVLLETKISFDYFLLHAKTEYDLLLQKFIDYVMLDKIRQLEENDKESKHKIIKSEERRKKWMQIKDEISKRYSSAELKSLQNNGFLGMPLKNMAEKTNNMDLYNMAYRLCSRNIHLSDLTDQFQYFRSIKNNEVFAESRFNMLIAIMYECGLGIVYYVNEWLGDPTGLKKAISALIEKEKNIKKEKRD